MNLCRVSSTRAEREIRQMMLLGLCEGTWSASRERLRRIRNGEVISAHVLQGSRFGCQNSGACCHGYVFGSISNNEKQRIEALTPRERLPHLNDVPLFVPAGVSGGHQTYRLGMVGDACVFLEEGPSCGLHRAFGAASKPALCQLYPLAAVATINGLKIYDRGECATFAVSSRTGPLLESDIPRLRALTQEDLYHPVVHLHDHWRCDYAAILALGSRLEEEATSRSPLLALQAMGHIARGLIAALVQCPFEAGQPEELIAATLKSSTEAMRPPEAQISTSAYAGLRSMGVLAEALAERVSPGEALTVPFQSAARLLTAVCVAVHAKQPIPRDTKAAMAIVVGRDSESVLSWSLRQQLFGRELLLDDQLPGGLLRMAFVVVLTLAGARMQALQDGTGHILPQHVSAAHMIAKRTLQRPEPYRLLCLNGKQAWCILDALPLLDESLGFDRRHAVFQS